MSMSAETTETRVPFLDLGAIHGPLKDELLESFSALIDSGAFINGPAVREFEDAFADYVGTSSAVGVASGLDALRLGLLAAGLQPGDAGALTTNDGELADLVKSLREHGQRAKYEHEREGYTGRLDTIQAIVLLAKLARLDAWNDERRTIANHYLERLEGVGDLELPPVAADSSPVWHLFVVRTADPAALADALKARGIATGRHYPEPVHLTKAYRWLGYE